ncbi:MAG: hypothetical protein HKP61_20575 [Dactylosporangium sp.]|nr:hypothetical protein [Dactylosporangium sp.]
MSTPSAGQTRQTHASIPVTSEASQLYAAALQATDPNDVPAIELLRTMFADVSSVSTASLARTISNPSLRTSLYRDAGGTLVVRRHDDADACLSLLWPVGPRKTEHPETTKIVGSRGSVFLADEKSGDVVPLPATATTRHAFGWGMTDHRVVNLYLALVLAVSGERAPVPRPSYRDHPDSLYGWLARQDSRRDLEVPWPAVARMVDDDGPLRRAATDASSRAVPQAAAGSLFAASRTGRMASVRRPSTL